MNTSKLVMPRWREPGSPAPLRLAEWVDHALCGTERGDWLSHGRHVDSTAEKRVCRRCPVREACLAYALDAGEPSGIWGGLAVEERRALVARLTAVQDSPAATLVGHHPHRAA